MMNTLSPDKRRFRRLALACLLGVGTLVFSMAGAGWMLRSSQAAGERSDGPTSAAPGAGQPAVYCLGHVDVEGGVVSPYPTQPGTVVEVPVREGQAVKKDDVLFRVDDEPARRDVERAEAAVREAEALLSQAQSAVEQLKAAEAAQAAAVEAAKVDV